MEIFYGFYWNGILRGEIEIANFENKFYDFINFNEWEELGKNMMPIKGLRRKTTK